MTEKQKRFADEFIVSLNGAEAYSKVYSNCQSPYATSSRLLADKEIQQYISERVGEITAKLELKQEIVIEELVKVAFANIKDYLSFNEDGVSFKNSDNIDGSVVSEVSSVKIITKSSENEITEKVSLKLKLHDKMKALDNLGKYFKLFTDKVEHSGGLSLEELLMQNQKKIGTDDTGEV